MTQLSGKVVKVCVNYDILQRNGGHKCLCTGLLYDPSEVKYHPENRFMQTNENPSVAPAHTEAPDGKLIEELEQLLATWKKESSARLQRRT